MSFLSSTSSALAPPRFELPRVLRIALRELRGGLTGFGIFLACIALGVAAISGVGSVARGLVDGLAREGRTILGGDVSFSLIHRELKSDETAFLMAQGSVSKIANLRGMARRADGTAALVEIKAVGPDYPRLGTATLSPPMPLVRALGQQSGLFGVAVDATLLARLDVKLGDRIAIGEETVEIRTILASEPDKLATGVGFGPRVLMSLDALSGTGLVQPGSLMRWTYRLLLPPTAEGSPASDAAVAAVMEDARRDFPDAGWEIRTRGNVSPQFTKNLERFTQFLTLVGLTALVVGGVGVANAVSLYVERKRGTIATLKSLGASATYVFGLMLVEVMLVALLGIAIGLGIGAALPYVAATALGAIIPFPLVPQVYPVELGLGFAYGILTALTFALAPLGRTHDVSVSGLFRDRVDPARRWPRPRYLVLVAVAATSLAALAIACAWDRTLAAYYTASVIVAFLLLRLLASALMALTRAVPRPRNTELRLALGNIHRPGALTPAVVLSLGLGLGLLVALALVEGNIRGELIHARPGETPSFFFVDIQSRQAPDFEAFLHRLAPTARIDRVPMLRGRILQVGGTRAEDLHTKENVAWVLEGDRGITYAATPPRGSHLVAGDWWPPDYSGPPLVSLDRQVADGFGLKLGDTIVVNVLGRSITAKIANFRDVDWRSFGINFVLVFSPNTFAGAPHSDLATLTLPPNASSASEMALVKQVAATYPDISTVRVREALDTVNQLVGQLALAIRGASSVALASAILVLAGALAAGERARIYDAVVLKTLGATRMRLLVAFLMEYAVLGFATALFGIAAGAGAAYAVVTRVMQLDFRFLWGPALVWAGSALALTLILGLVGTWRVLGKKPAPYLRSL